MPEYQNPQHQEPDSQRRLLLVFAATFIILLLAQPLMKRFMPQPEPKPAPAAQQSNTSPTPAPATPPAASASTPVTAAPGSKQAASETETVVENDLYRIVFTNRGGQVKSWVLKKFADDTGKPQELVNQGASQQFGYPMSLFTYDAALRQKLNSALFVANVTGQQSAPTDLTFEYADGDVVVHKTFHFDHSYVVHVDAAVTRAGQAVAAFPAWPAGFGDQTVATSYASARIDYQDANGVNRLSPDRKGQSISGGGTLHTSMFWGGPIGQYFAAVFLPDQPSTAALVMQRNALEIPQNLDKPEPGKTTKVEVLGAAVGNPSGTTSERVFVGPKAVDVLEKIKATPLSAGQTAPDLGAVVDFGRFFGIIAKPLFLWLKWTQQHMIPNWGWAIAFLTLVINLALLPLRISSMKSSLKMQKVQPIVKNMQDRYKAKMAKMEARDPRKRELQMEMNQEMMKIYKENSINPAGGCLPLLIQMPFLIAFYTMLGATIELRHAPWLWVRDLASPDPFHILPILIVASTFLMQKSTPNPGMDPNQQRMMNFMMPVMLGFFAWNYAAGLSVYWLIGTLIAIVQQHVTNRTAFGKEMRAVMEKRARKHDDKK